MWLVCQYGQDLDVPLIWQGLAVYVQASVWTGLMGLGAAFISGNVEFAICCGTAWVLAGNGMRLVYLLGAVGVWLRKSQLNKVQGVVGMGLVGSLLYDLLGRRRTLNFDVMFQPLNLLV